MSVATLSVKPQILALGCPQPTDRITSWLVLIFLAAGSCVNPHRTLDNLTEIASWEMALTQFSNEDLIRAVIYHTSLLDTTTENTKQAEVRREMEGLGLEGIEFDKDGQIKDKDQCDRFQQWSGGQGKVCQKIRHIFESISGAFEWRSDELKIFTTFRRMPDELEVIDRLNDNEVAQVLLQYHYSELHCKTEVCVSDPDRRSFESFPRRTDQVN